MRITISTVFKDKQGKIRIWQQPNILLYGWIACQIAALFVGNDTVKHDFSRLGTALIFTWAYLEIMEGVNYFRRGLGLLVLILTVYGFFR